MSKIPLPTFTHRNAAFLASTSIPYPPPAGVTANLNSPNVNGTIFVVISIIGLVLATLFTLMRVYTKTYLTRALGWDDYTCVLAMICIFIWTGLNIQMALLALGRHYWNAPITYRNLETYQRDALIVNTIYFVILCLVKVSILLMYLRTFAIHRIFRWAVWTIMFILVSSHLVTWIIYWTSINRLSCYWLTYPITEYLAICHRKFDIRSSWVFLGTLTILLDVIILAMPCPHVWKLQMAKRQKIAIIMILLAGVIVTIASTLRLVYMIIRFYYDLPEWAFREFQMNLTSTIEVDLAIICACFPTLRAFMKRFAPNVLKLSSDRQKVSYGSRSLKRSVAPQSSVLQSGKADRGWESDPHNEHLVGDKYVEIELAEDGKSDRSDGIAPAVVHPQSV